MTEQAQARQARAKPPAWLIRWKPTLDLHHYIPKIWSLLQPLHPLLNRVTTIGAWRTYGLCIYLVGIKHKEKINNGPNSYDGYVRYRCVFGLNFNIFSALNV